MDTSSASTSGVSGASRRSSRSSPAVRRRTRTRPGRRASHASSAAPDRALDVARPDEDCGDGAVGHRRVQAPREAELLQAQVDADVVELLLQRDGTGRAQAMGEERAELGERVARRVGVLLDVARSRSQDVVHEVHGDRAVGCLRAVA